MWLDFSWIKKTTKDFIFEFELLSALSAKNKFTFTYSEQNKNN